MFDDINVMLTTVDWNDELKVQDCRKQLWYGRQTGMVVARYEFVLVGLGVSMVW